MAPDQVLRCAVTGNPCGTDTWMEGHSMCGQLSLTRTVCPQCQAWLALKQFADPANWDRSLASMTWAGKRDPVDFAESVLNEISQSTVRDD